MTNVRQKPHIVLIEDNAGDAFLVQRALRKYSLDCDLTRIEDGETALAAVTGASELRPPDLVLLDLNLPLCGGCEVLEALRGNPALARTPVAVLTSSFAPRDREDAVRLGANRYIQKPSDLNGFLQAVGSVVMELLPRAASRECESGPPGCHV